MKRLQAFLLAVFLGWLPLFAVQKPVFMLYHHALAGGCSAMDYARVVMHGLLLDCTVAGYLTIIPLLCALLSIWLPGAFYKKVLRWYFAAGAVLVSAIFAIDVALYGYWGFRLDATLLFYLRSPKDAMASVPIMTLLLQLLLFLVYAWVIYRMFRRFVIPLFPTTAIRHRPVATLAVLLLGGVLFIPIRGGVTTSTANVGMVYFSKNQFLNHSAINPTFSLLASLSKQQDFAAQFNFFPEEERARRYAALTGTNNTQGEKPSLLKTTRPNILIILLESFSANAVEAVGGEPGVTPNLNRLSREGITFTNMYANSFRTDRGIVAVLNGYPAQPTTSIMKYPAKSRTLPSIAKSLGKEGYTADMLYGGDINFTNMQSYFFSSGYSKITADRDFPISERLSKWGVADDRTFDHLYESIRTRDNSSPWLSTFLTLSSHEPFEVPYHHLEDPYLNSVAFTDSCLGSFIRKLKALPVWENMLVVLVSDHGFRYPSSLTDYEPRRFHIPMIWLGGAVKAPATISTYANQTDLAATLLSQLNIGHEDFTFSRDLLTSGYTEYAFYTFPNGFGFIDNTGFSVYDNEGGKPLMEQPSGSDQRLNNGKVLLQTLYDDLGRR